jgi:hypothetical protein
MATLGANWSLAPGDEEVAECVHGDGRRPLVVGRGQVHQEFVAPSGAVGGEALGEDAVAASVSARALPGHHEVSVGVHGHGRCDLVAGRGGVDLELLALADAAGGEALAVDAAAAAVLPVALPGHDEAAVVGHGDGG